MKSKKNFIFRRFVGLSLMILAMLLCSITSAAQEQDEPDFTKKGTINVTMKNPPLTGEIIPGGKMELYQVAELKKDGKLYGYHYSTGFEGQEFDLTTEGPIAKGGADLRNMADSLAAFIKNSNGSIQPIAEIPINDNGYGSVADLDLGVYLLIQSEVSDPDKYQPSDPFLVTVPYFDEDGKISYEVDASPKTRPGSVFVSAAGTIKKNVEGTTNNDAFFEFTFERLTNDSPMPVNPTGMVDEGGSVVSVSADKLVIRRQGSGDLAIGDITFKNAGDFFYQVTETGEPENYTIDDTVYWLKYEIVKRETDDKLVIQKVTAKKDGPEGSVVYEGETGDTLTFTFTNTYDEGGIQPPTSEKETTEPEETTTTQETTTQPTTTRSYTGGGPSGGGSSGGPSHRPGFSSSSSGTPQEGVADSGSEVLGVDRALSVDTPEGRVLGANRKVLGANRLPRTGQLWWPVPILLLFGAGMIGKGIYDRSKNES